MNTLPATVTTPAPTFTPVVLGKTDDGNVVPFINLEGAAKELGEAIAEYDKHIGSALRAAIRIGHAAMVGRDLLPDGQFTKWMAFNFPAFSVQWARRCIQTAELYNLLEAKCSPAERDAIIDRMTSVEKAAAFLGTVKGLAPGESPLSKLDELQAAAPQKKIGRPAKAASMPKGSTRATKAPVLEGDQAHRSAAELLEWEEELQAREDKVAARERELDALQEELEALKAKLTLSAKAGDVIDVSAKTTPTVEELYEGATKPEWPATPAQQAAASSGKPRTSRAKGKGKGVVAPKADSAPSDEAM